MIIQSDHLQLHKDDERARAAHHPLDSPAPSAAAAVTLNHSLPPCPDRRAPSDAQLSVLPARLSANTLVFCTAWSCLLLIVISGPELHLILF